MFTGLIEEVGTVAVFRKNAAGALLEVRAKLDGVQIGESISINGACQTVAELTRDGFRCDILAETLRVTNLGLLRPGSRVNLERAMRLGDRFGGHFVSGHVDGMGRVERVSKRPLELAIEVPGQMRAYIVPKGSIAVNGVSLTVGPNPRPSGFEVFIVAHTWENTNLKELRAGSRVNIEVDIMAKHIETLMRFGRGERS